MRARGAKLDVILRWAEPSDSFDATLIYDDPDSALDRVDLSGSPLRFDTEALDALVGEEERYAATLSKMLFDNSDMRGLFDRALAPRPEVPVQVRLLIDHEAPARYQAIRWEIMQAPGTNFRLTTNEGIYFSRFLEGPGWAEAGSLVRTGRLRALLAVANPSDIADYNQLGATTPPLAPVDVNAEVTLACRALEGMAVTVLAREQSERATLSNLIEALRKGIDVMYLVCHGQIADEGSELLLEDDDGDVDSVSGQYLASRIADLPSRPTIAVLCACNSGGPGDEYLPSLEGPLAALGPMLATAGVPIVVAMQGNVTMTSARRFFPKFFSELERDGLADRSMAVARAAISDRPDWWMPVLFSRLKRAKVWYKPRFGGSETARFRDIWTRVKEGVCTPVIGSGVAGEGILPDREVLAQDWVARRQMPVSERSRRDLATVAQYLSVDSGSDMPRIELRQHIRRDLRDFHEEHLPSLDWEDAPLAGLIGEVGRHCRTQDGDDDLHTILASLRLPIYITTSWTSLLEDALEDAGRRPMVRYFNWHRQTQDADDIPPEIDVREPLVYHLFGTIDHPESTVITEDEYFAWLRAWMKRVDKGEGLPGVVRMALTAQSLMFVGYRLADWEFRVLFQSIKGFEGSAQLRLRRHVGVQFRPETTTIDPEAAQDYLENYFGEDHVDIYWGSCKAFLHDLRDSKPPS
jgi:hypothetical protein